MRVWRKQDPAIRNKRPERYIGFPRGCWRAGITHSDRERKNRYQGSDRPHGTHVILVLGQHLPDPEVPRLKGATQR